MAESPSSWKQIAELLPQTKAVLGRWCQCGDNEDGSEHWYWQQCSGRYFDHLGERHWCLDGYRFEGGPFYGEAPTYFLEIPDAPERSSHQPQPAGTQLTGSTSAPHPVGTNR